MRVNDEMLRFYWSVGEGIEKRQYENRYGSHLYENVSKDLRKELGLAQGLSTTTIELCKKTHSSGPSSGRISEGEDYSLRRNTPSCPWSQNQPR